MTQGSEGPTAQDRAVQSLRDWSKWLIGLEFGAGAGCVAIFSQSPSTTAVTPFLVVAILAFGLALTCAMLLLGELAALTERLPIQDENGRLASVFDQRGRLGLSIGSLVRWQLIFLAIAGVFFVAWVVTKAISG